jgi:hypothetical protein
VLYSPKLIANSFNTYFLTTVEKLNKSTKSPTEEEAIQYMTKTIPRTFPDINILPTMANKIKNIISSLKLKTHAVMMEYRQNYSKLAEIILVFL